MGCRGALGEKGEGALRNERGEEGSMTGEGGGRGGHENHFYFTRT